MIPSEFPELPWQKVGMDLFEWKKISYLLIVDYYSRYIEIAKLTNVTAEEVIRRTKSIFTRPGMFSQTTVHSLLQTCSQILLNTISSSILLVVHTTLEVMAVQSVLSEQLRIYSRRKMILI